LVLNEQMQDAYQHLQQLSSSAASQPVRVTTTSSVTTSAMSTGLSTVPAWQSSGPRSSSVPASASSVSQYQHSVFTGQVPSAGMDLTDPLLHWQRLMESIMFQSGVRPSVYPLF